MDYLKNHCWCSKSHWDGKMFDCKIIVGLSSYRDGYKVDWDNLTYKVKVFSQEKFDEHIRTSLWLKEKYPDEYEDIETDPEFVNSMYGEGTVSRLKPEVVEWLEANIPDIKGEKAWCVGSDDYNMNDGSGFSIFMQRRKDAMLFIKTWSEWKKPIFYTQYFTDVRKKLNLETLKYEQR